MFAIKIELQFTQNITNGKERKLDRGFVRLSKPVLILLKTSCCTPTEWHLGCVGSDSRTSLVPVCPSVEKAWICFNKGHHTRVKINIVRNALAYFFFLLPFPFFFPNVANISFPFFLLIQSKMFNLLSSFLFFFFSYVTSIPFLSLYCPKQTC